MELSLSCINLLIKPQQNKQIKPVCIFYTENLKVVINTNFVATDGARLIVITNPGATSDDDNITTILGFSAWPRQNKMKHNRVFILYEILYCAARRQCWWRYAGGSDFNNPDDLVFRSEITISKANQMWLSVARIVTLRWADRSQAGYECSFQLQERSQMVDSSMTWHGCAHWPYNWLQVAMASQLVVVVVLESEGNCMPY